MKKKICVDCDRYRCNYDTIKLVIPHACLSEKDPILGKSNAVGCRKKNKKGDCSDYIPKDKP